MKLIVPALLVLSLALPAGASAAAFRPSLLQAEDPPLIKIVAVDDDDDDDDDDDHDRRWRKHGRKDRGYRDERRAYRQGYRDGRWEQRRYDGYRPGGHDDYRRFGRGDYLPPEYRSHVIYDYDEYGYPPPPRGCRYVRVGQDTYLLQIATGMILNAFLGGRY